MRKVIANTAFMPMIEMFTVSVLASAVLLAVTAATAQDRETVQRESQILYEHCVQCCNTLREEAAELRLDDSECVPACEAFAREIAMRRLGL